MATLDNIRPVVMCLRESVVVMFVSILFECSLPVPVSILPILPNRHIPLNNAAPSPTSCLSRKET